MLNIFWRLLIRFSYLTGNFAPVQQTRPLTPCTYIGQIPPDLAGGQYVRNGGNPVSNQDLGRDAHWFDGDGMLSGVAFKRSDDGSLRPHFVNQYILTDAFISTVTSPTLKTPILPSIATLVNPVISLFRIIWTVFRTLFLVVLSHLAGSWQPIKKISVANTNVLYHDGRALATCESGPPIRIQLPGLETVGWFNGNRAEGEINAEIIKEHGFGEEGLIGFMKEWTTGHPKVDPVTKDMILYHCTFVPPYVHYSVLPAAGSSAEKSTSQSKLLNILVPKVSGGKMMHDFGVSRDHSIILDLPLSLDPLNLLKCRPVVSFDTSKPSRFGVFPRRDPSAVRWFETAACCIFHTANSWDEKDSSGRTTAVNMLACRLTSAALVFSAGNLQAPILSYKSAPSPDKPMSFFSKYDHDEVVSHNTIDETSPLLDHFDDARQIEEKQENPQYRTARRRELELEEDQCCLYYYRFDLCSSSNRITHQFALSVIPFEFPTLHPQKEMSTARYIYGCSTSTESFGSALGRAVKIDVIAKIDALTLLDRARARPPRSVTGCMDERSVSDVLDSRDENDPIRCFKMPEGWYAQEARFVPRANEEQQDEDDGYLLFYAFDESHLDAEGEAPDSSISELWILDARNMRDVICRVLLPQRVPYGLHGNWFSEEMIADQRGAERFRTVPDIASRRKTSWDWVRNKLIAAMG